MGMLSFFINSFICSLVYAVASFQTEIGFTSNIYSHTQWYLKLADDEQELAFPEINC